jgi:hypothetical protein
MNMWPVMFIPILIALAAVLATSRRRIAGPPPDPLAHPFLVGSLDRMSPESRTPFTEAAQRVMANPQDVEAIVADMRRSIPDPDGERFARMLRFIAATRQGMDKRKAAELYILRPNDDATGGTT